MDGYFVLHGNDGVGKSTLVKKLCQRGIDALERSTLLDHPELNESAKIFNTLTLQPTYSDLCNIKLLDTYQGRRVYHVILDATVEEIEKRISIRDQIDIFETTKALSYFSRRYREMAARFGLPLIQTTGRTFEEIIAEIISIPAYYQECRQFALHSLNRNDLETLDIENIISYQDVGPIDDLSDEIFKIETENLKTRIAKRWLVRGQKAISGTNLIVITRTNTITQQQYTATLEGPLLECVDEGESKKIYRVLTNNPYLKDIAIILLKSTIYSHSMQSTGNIDGLGAIRAKGTQIFLEMMWRNGLQHTYRYINSEGIIVSDYLPTVPPTEIVVKKYCQGTDKHSFYGMVTDPAVVVPETGEYAMGPYVRFDWRNPNHIIKSSKTNVADNPYYYTIESEMGKDTFFRAFLQPRDGHSIVPLGDRAVPDALLKELIDRSQTRESVLKMFFTIQHYFEKVGLEIQDVCFMLDRDGKIFWSEINPDCMRIKVPDNTDHFDKDIWRTGGSGAAEKIKTKWGQFNQLMIAMFDEHPFHDGEMLEWNRNAYEYQIRQLLDNQNLRIPADYLERYQRLIRRPNQRRVIVTMDLYDQSPVLVKSGAVVEKHSNGSWQTGIDHIAIFPDVLCVDLNGAMGNGTNRAIINQLAAKHYIHTGGGLRTIDDVQDVLSNSVRRVVISSNTEQQFIEKIPKERLIVELSVNEKNEVLIHGRETNTRVDLFEKMREMAQCGVQVISITFHHTEGHLSGIPRQQIRDICLRMPRSIEKLIIAGGISTMDDLEYLWSLPKIIPQLGSAIWKNRITIGDLYVAMTKFDSNGLTPAVIQDNHGRNKGLVYLNADALKQSCETRVLHQYSRDTGTVSQHNTEQQVIQISTDRESNGLLITVDSSQPFYKQNYSGFSLQTTNKSGLGVITDHLLDKKSGKTYSGKMQRNPGFALSKVMEEFWEIVAATDRTKVHECSDLIIHLLMYMNGVGINFEDIINELNARRWTPRLTAPVSTKKDSTTVVLAITGNKYSGKSDAFVNSALGIDIIRPTGRDMYVKTVIVDQHKYQQHFGNKKVVMFPCRPKDIPWLIAYGRVDGAISYNTVMDNFPAVATAKMTIPDNDLRLCLIKRKDEEIQFTTKTLIAVEHMKHVSEFLRAKGYTDEQFSIDRVMGSSEGFMVNNPEKYALCDAVVESGATIKENNLEIWDTILDRGQITIGWYMKSFA